MHKLEMLDESLAQFGALVLSPTNVNLVDRLLLIENLFNFLSVVFVERGCVLNDIFFSVFPQLGASIIQEVVSSFQTLMDEYSIPFSLKNLQEISVQASKLNKYLIGAGI
ncbi:hypothetical protein MXB_2126 [Myxobolus squamalis]|nr:hypothetical protein MXB_2126 [Myxobolus squamalis]